MEKPNFEKIAEIIDLAWNIWSADEPIMKTLSDKWQGIVSYQNNGEVQEHKETVIYFEKLKVYKQEIDWVPPFAYPDYEFLSEMLKRNNLEILGPDFRFLAYLFKDIKRLKEEDEDTRYNYIKEFRGSRLELLQALKLLREQRNGISINFIRKQRVCGSLTNSESIHVIEDALFKQLRNIDHLCNPMFIDGPLSKSPKSWLEYLELRIEKEKEMMKENSSRIKKDSNWHLRISVFYLWEYLQRFTIIKSTDDKCTNEQGRFIFEFLDKIGLINKYEITEKEDVIRYYLKSCREELLILKDYNIN